MSEKSGKIACQRVFDDINPVIFFMRRIGIKRRKEIGIYTGNSMYIKTQKSWVGQQKRRRSMSHDDIIM